MIDPKMAEAAFALEKDELSKPVEGQFSTALLHVTDIEAGKQRTFDEVKGRSGIASPTSGRPELQDLHDKIETERAAGKSLKEIAESLKLRFREMAEIDRSGKTPDGKPPLEQADAAGIARAAFRGRRGRRAEASS